MVNTQNEELNTSGKSKDIKTLGEFSVVVETMKDDINQIVIESEAKDIMLEKRDEKIQNITRIFLAQINNFQERLKKIEKFEYDRINKGEVIVNQFDIAELTEPDLEKIYRDFFSNVSDNLGNFTSDNFLAENIDTFIKLTNLKSNNNGTISDGNSINEIGEKFIELVAAYGVLVKEIEKIEKFKIEISALSDDNRELTDDKIKSDIEFNKLEDDYTKLLKMYDDLLEKYNFENGEYKKMDSENEMLYSKIDELKPITDLGNDKIEEILSYLEKEKRSKKGTKKVENKGSKVIGEVVSQINYQAKGLKKQLTDSEKENLELQRKILQLEKDKLKQEKIIRNQEETIKTQAKTIKTFTPSYDNILKDSINNKPSPANDSNIHYTLLKKKVSNN